MDTHHARVIGFLEAARRQGARQAEVLVDQGHHHTAIAHRGRLVETTETTPQRVVVRVWLDTGQEGEASHTAGGELEGLYESLAKGALARAAKAPQERATQGSGPIQRSSTTPRGLGLDDRRYPTVDLDARKDVALEAERGARSAHRSVLSTPFRYEDTRSRRVYMNTRDVVLDETATLYRCEGGVRMELGKDELLLYDRLAGRTFASISSLPFGTVLARRALSLATPTLEVEGPVRVVLPPHITAAIVDRLGLVFTYDAVARGENALAGHALDPRLHLLDDGTMPGALRTTAFDDRGAGPLPLTLLRDGTLDARHLDHATAQRLDASPTGHEQADGLRPRNLMLRSGTRSMNAILADLKGRTFHVEHVRDLDGLNLKTGDLSMIAYGLVKDGAEVAGAAHAVRLRGNLVDLFQHVVDVSSDTDRHEHIDAPGLLLDGFEAERL